MIGTFQYTGVTGFFFSKTQLLIQITTTDSKCKNECLYTIRYSFSNISKCVCVSQRD